MNEAEKQKIISELKNFYKKLRNYQIRQRRRSKIGFSEPQDRNLNALRLELQREYGRLANIISEYGGKAYVPVPVLGEKYEVFGLSLGSLNMKLRGLDALDGALSLVNHAIGKLESTPIAELEVQEVSITQELKDTREVPDSLFDKIQFHPRVIEASESLFKTGNYASAIFEAFKAVHNYVQDKTGLTLDGANLMEKVFNENKPILQLNELLTPSDKNEQKGFKHIFMGSQIGIRNPKAHENVKQEDPTRTLEYLSIASLLMRRIDESKLVKLNI
jgi:uncharacterized protein (TIGR02391 family)